MCTEEIKKLLSIDSTPNYFQYGSYGYIVEADIKGFFDTMNHDWLLKMLAVKIDDQALLNLINQWLKAKVVEPDGSKQKPSAGTPQKIRGQIY